MLLQLFVSVVAPLAEGLF
ncbi:Putative uncharacterized protein [Lactococcus lactis subsp. lactis A12]|uniref:Uncharacterized protein n=1 Tax=Lactococcus lactis subsp. lactis A12 TaxID=1137134 RepID=S6EYJ9_LACLL|nr:Putative uncharacterized protein [Lactococcus lactis subsp. lactis A12]CDG04481.1 Putative uncharacterized protein [Lactococcus lactis subsp. lactis A12]CDG04489.1 Putative uncharacterized protein [Lactococcus lactis subsp. lactis A12]